MCLKTFGICIFKAGLRAIVLMEKENEQDQVHIFGIYEPDPAHFLSTPGPWQAAQP